MCSLPDSTLFPVQLRHSSSKRRPPGSRTEGGLRDAYIPRASRPVARHFRPQQHTPGRGVHHRVRVPLGAGALLRLHPDYVMTHRLTPLAPDHTHVECEWLFSPEAVEQEDFDPSIRQRLLGRDQPPGLDRTRGRAEGRLLARLPPGSPLPPRGRCLPLQHDGRQRLPRRRNRTPRQPRPYTINITGFSSTRLTSAM